jgi:uncharacterized protein
MFSFNPQHEKKVLLSLDGGGMRGIIPLAMMAELEKQTGQTVHSIIDMVGGTSTGSLIAAAFAVGFSAQDTLDNIYKTRLPQSFPQRNFWFYVRWALNGFRYFYSLDPFLNLIKPLAEGKKVRDLQRPIILMTTKDLRTGNTYYVVSAGPGAEPFLDWPLAGAVAASGAAPVYFPPVLGNLVDGGVGVFGNPCLVTATEAMEYIGASEGFVPGNVIHISLGTGFQPNNLKDGEGARYNILDWVKYVTTESLIDAALQQVMVTKAIYSKSTDFRRYNPLLTQESVRDILGVKTSPNIDPATLGLDSTKPEEIELMEEIGRAYARAIDWSIPGAMPWDTKGGHQQPGILPVNWKGTPYE